MQVRLMRWKWNGSGHTAEVVIRLKWTTKGGGGEGGSTIDRVLFFCFFFLVESLRGPGNTRLLLCCHSLQSCGLKGTFPPSTRGTTTFH